MFRKPREAASSSTDASVKPSTGRPPTPEHIIPAYHRQAASAMTTRGSSKPLTPRANTKANVPTLGRQSAKKTAVGKASGKPNGNILNFFKKVDSPIKDDSIFLSQASPAGNEISKPRDTSPDLSDDESGNLYDDEEDTSLGRYNEVEGSIKRRKLSSDITLDRTGQHTTAEEISNEQLLESKTSLGETCTPPPPEPASRKPTKKRNAGPFLDDSDTEEDLDNEKIQKLATKAEKKELDKLVSKQPSSLNSVVETNSVSQEQILENKPIIPSLTAVTSISRKCSSGSTGIEALNGKSASNESGESPYFRSHVKEEPNTDDFEGFDGLDDFPDEYVEGEEFVERKWMEEQALLEGMEGAEHTNDDLMNAPAQDNANQMAATCPICEANLGNITSDQASRHVNACLDGKPIPIPMPVKEEESQLKLMPVSAKNRFSKAAIARPGQQNPFELGSTATAPATVFSKLMSSKVEDAAWASAAAAENASRGKAAYQRTCPFYKIMPGFFICVDAFRYGAVQGCNAYFLSHFHSDHYIGLTSSWCHGPIYCSKVTANLVKQQLKVDPKWVVALDFEERVDVPGTEGVAVTMIPANHCPGSSLYLFEKVIGKGTNPKIQRILHCGDFRACPAHISHPLLMPDVVDSITGKTRQQKIDVCYLDTTYLNPRYAFPSQEDVITSCADMCVSLTKERAEETDAWEKVKKERAGSGMTKFVQSALKSEDGSIAMDLDNKKARGRLLVICGTYSIGKERICMGIARALDCKIWAPPGKRRICAALEDPELMSRLTDDPKEAQIHMQMIMEIRPETLQDYLNGYKPHFSRIVGFRPSGWNYKPPNSRFTDSPSIPTILHSTNWCSRYSMAELVPQRGSTREASCFGVPYSEHSSFRELTMFVCALRIEKVIPTVNVGSAPGRAKMKGWIERWQAERRKNGPLKLGQGAGECRW
ncbi:DNA repair protein pso2 [Phlyctema vagabunda]|uniref:DNA repair protein pso2 n=1 Tax=Phlyctema vagabunda TaxID=108571 RepID=A0ABR4P6C0_9HELO